jgi:putative N6-adenine-specific DNA methylase
MITEKEFKIIVKTSFGLEEVLMTELKQLGINNAILGNRAVTFTGNLNDLYKANLWLRTANRIIVPLQTFKISSDTDLYNKMKLIKWDDYFSVKQSFLIDSTVFSSLFNHTKYAAFKAKDAVVDQFRDKYGIRPNINTENPDIRLNLHIDAQNNCTISLDSSGEILSKRGFKESQSIAPMKEDLAAGMILLSDWDKKSTFIDLFCGSGTLLIEATMIAKNIAPNLKREKFGFMNWKNYDADLFTKIKNEAIAAQKPLANKIIGVEISGRSLGMARANISGAGLLDVIELHKKDFREFNAPADKGVIVSNPPYGERIGENVDELYKDFGDTLKKKYNGYSAWFISSNMEALKKVGLKPSKKIKLFNGNLECRLMNYQMYDGSKKMEDRSQMSEETTN